MAAPSSLCYAIIFLLVSETIGAPTSSSKNAEQLCSSAKLIAPGQSSLIYKYKTEVKLSVANGQFDLENEYTADVHIKSLGDCNYALQLRNVKITESKDEKKSTVSSTAAAQRSLESTVVRFRWIDGYLVALEADSSAKIENVNFIKGVLSALQVQSPVPADMENIIREEDVLGVCTTRYKYFDQGSSVQVKKSKDLLTCSRDKLHLGASPILTSLLGPLIEEAFTAKSRYVCQTEIRDKTIQTVNCKTVEVDEDKKNDNKNSDDDDSAEEDDDADNDDEISTKLVSIKQELKLQPGGSANVETGNIRKADRQTLQFVPTPSFDRSNQPISALIKKLQDLMDSKGWTEFAASQFVQVTNELRRMERSNLNSFKNNADLKHLVPSLLKTVYASDPAAAPLNFDSRTMKFSNPLSVYYLDDPSSEFVDQIVQAARQITNSQVRDFVGLAATILKTYKNRETHNQDADNKIREFQKAISRFLETVTKERAPEIVAVLAAYAQLGLYEERVRRLAASEQAPLDVQYHALNAIRHISEDYIDKENVLKTRTDLQNTLLRKLQNKNNRNSVRIWAFEALYTPFIFNPEEDDPTLSDNLEKTLESIVNEPLNQVNGYIWSALKYSSLDRRCPLRGLAARIRTHLVDKKKFTEQATLSSRQIQLDLPLRKNYRAAIEVSVIFENDRATPSFLSVSLSFDGVRRETRRLEWVKGALLIENLDWNVADYFLRLDPLNSKDNDDENKERTKSNLPPALKKLQDNFDNKEEDPDPNVHIILQLFGADIRINDATAKVQDLLRSNVRTFIRNALLNRMKDLGGEKPIYRLPLEIGAAVAAANGLTLYRAAQVGILADLSNEFQNTRDENGIGKFILNSKSAISVSLTLTREVSSPLAAVGETVQIGAVTNVPFEYSAVADETGRIREFNFPNERATVLSTDFQYSVRSSSGLDAVPNVQSSATDPSCTPSQILRIVGIQLCLQLNPFRSIQLGSRPSYPIKVTLGKDPSIKKWRVGWRFGAKDAPQYEVSLEKVGASGNTYPGLGISATKNGNNFDIKVLNGMKSFNVKGTQNGNRFNGKVYSSEGKEVMTTSGSLTVDDNGFKLDSKLVDSSNGREVVNLVTEILPNKGDGLSTNIALTTPDKSKSAKIHFRGDLYKTERKLFHITGAFNLGQVSYDGKLHLERDEEHTQIEMRRSFQSGSGALPSGYDFVYERKCKHGGNENTHNIKSHLALKTPKSADPMKVAELKADFTRSKDESVANLQSTLDFVLLTRNPPVQERISLDYSRQSVKTANQAKRLISPQAQLKLQLKTKSNFFNVLLDHRHRLSTEPSKKGPATLPPTLDIENKLHIAADSDKLLPDIPRPFAFEVLSDLDFDLLNKIDYKAEYNLPRRQRSASITYSGQIERVDGDHHFYGTSQSELLWDNKQKKASGVGTFTVCTRSRTLTSHWDIDTNLVPDKKDAELDLVIRLDPQPKPNAPKSFIGVYNVSLKAPKHEALQSLDLLGNVTRQEGLLETFNSVAFRKDRKTRELNLNALVNRNRTGDGSLKTNLVISLPFKNIPYITHSLSLERESPNGPVSEVHSQLLAEPVASHFLHVGIDRSEADRPPRVSIENEFEYLRANGDNLYGLGKVNVQRWSALHSFGILKRNTDLLHKHSIGYIFSKKTRKVALSLESPQLSGNPFSIIGELTIDRENRIGKMKWPQEFGFQVELGTPLTDLTGLHVYYNLPMFNKEDEQTVDGTIGFKIASAKIDPIAFYIHSHGSLNSTLHVSESLNIGDDIALSTHLTGQYNPLLASQISVTANTKYYGRETHNSIFALFKQHQITIRGVLNTTEYKDYQYEMDIGFDSDALIGHSERSDGEQVVISDIDAKRCTPTGKYARCYKGDIVIRSGDSGRGNKGTFDLTWGSGTAKLDVQVPNGIELRFDHTHTGRLRDLEFNSKTNIDAKLLRQGQKGSFSYAGTVDKQDGKWNVVKLSGSATDPRNGQKAIGARVNMVNSADRRSGGEKRTVEISYERDDTVLDWSSDSVSCPNQGNQVLYGICRIVNFKVKASNKFIQRLRDRLELPADPRISNSNGQVDYDGKLQLDLKASPKQGPHKANLEVNRLGEDAVDVDVNFQPRSPDTPMGLKLKAKLPRQSPISVNYDETPRSSTSYRGVLKYSFDANNPSAEKTYQCEVDRESLEDFSIDCKGERTTLAIDIDRNAGKSKIYIDLNRFAGERVGYELTRNPQTKQLDVTLYTLVNSWNFKREPEKSSILTVKQKNNEVLRVALNKLNPNEAQASFSPSGVNLKIQWDKSGVFTIKQTAPTQRDIFSVTINRAKIRPYLPSLRNQDRPSLDIDEPNEQSRKPLVEIALGSHVFLALSQALDKIGSHNGLYGLDTIKKSYKLTIGDATLTIYNIQHWKTHGEESQLPESYAVRVVNDANGNIVQLSTQRWDETRMITKIGHSFDGGKSLTTDLKIDRDYAVPVGSLYFFRSLGYRNIEGTKNLRNFTRHFLKTHLMSGLRETGAAQLVQDFRARLRSILEVDYAAAKEVVQSWNKENEKSFLRRWSNRLGLVEFFDKYPTYKEASEAFFAILIARQVERTNFWRNRTEAILNDNRLQSLTERIERVRQQVIESLSTRAEGLLERFLPPTDQAAIDKRIADYVTKLLDAFKKSATQGRERWKNAFKAIDDATKGSENQWFRTLVADIDSASFAAASDAELAKMFKRLDDSSKLFTNNLQQFSRRISKGRENIRERVRNAIRHVPRVYMNGTNFEILFPLGREPGTYAGTSELILGIGSLLRNRDQAFDTMRAILVNRLDARMESVQNYLKGAKALLKRILKRKPSLTPEFKGVIAETGDALNVQNDYVYLNPACDYVLAHDFADLKFSFRFSNGKFYSMIPTQSEIQEYQCSETGRVQLCCDKDFCVLNVPMYYGGRVDGALGDVRDRSGRGHLNLNKWLLRDCPEARREPPRRDSTDIPECADPNDDNVKFCRGFVQDGLRRGKSKYELLTQVDQARREAI